MSRCRNAASGAVAPAGIRAVCALPSSPLVRRKAAVLSAVAWFASGAVIAAAQARFAVIDQNAIDGVAGLRILTLRDTVLNSCYLVFLNDPEPATHHHNGVETADIDQARRARDGYLAELLRAYEQDRSALPGTIIPNPLKYDWQADATQLEYALLVLEQRFAHLEQELDRIGDATRRAITALPVPCAPPATKRTP